MASHHYFTLDEKIALISDYADGAELPQCRLRDKYKISKHVVYNVFQRKNKYKQGFQLNSNHGTKRQASR